MFACVNLMNAQSKRMSKKKKAEPYMHIGFETPLWISDPNTLDNSHKAGFGFRADFPIKSGPWNFVTGFSNYNFGEHTNILNISSTNSISGNEGTITVKEGTYLIKYAGLPLEFKYDNKFWSSSVGFQLMFNLNQAEMHTQEITFIFGADEFEDFSKEKINRFNTSFVYSFAGKLPLGDKWSVILEPEFQYLMKPVYKDNIDNVNRSNFFLKLGVRHLITLPND